MDFLILNKSKIIVCVIILLGLIIYSQYWKARAINYQKQLNLVKANYEYVQRRLDDQLKINYAKKKEAEDKINSIRNTTVSNNCEEAVDWMRSSLSKKR